MSAQTWTRRTRIWAAVLIALIVLELIGIAVSLAADSQSCHAYANRGSAAALRSLLPYPFIDVGAGKFLYRKAYFFCLNADEVPPLVFTPEEQPIVDGLPAPKARPEPPPASVPAVDATKADMSAAWKKCARSHPRGWDATTHTVTKLVSKKWIRVPCP